MKTHEIMMCQVVLKKEGDDILCPIPDEVLAALGLKLGDDIRWKIKDGSLFLMRKRWPPRWWRKLYARITKSVGSRSN